MYFVLFQDSRYEWRWTLRAANHEPIAMASEGYTTKYNCRRSIDLVKGAFGAPVRER